MNKKMLVSDYDNTFYLNDKDIKENTLAVKEFRKNNVFVFATGRSYDDFMKVKNKYELEYDYLIINHGSTILDNNDNLFNNFCLDKNIVSKISDDLLLDKATSYFCCSFLESRVDIKHDNLTKINIEYGDNKLKNKILNNLMNKYNDLVNILDISDYTIEIVAKTVGKEKAIDLLANKININEDDIYTIGDGHSDFGMIKKFNGYCMEKSYTGLKSIAIQAYDSVRALIKDIS